MTRIDGQLGAEASHEHPHLIRDGFDLPPPARAAPRSLVALAPTALPSCCRYFRSGAATWRISPNDATTIASHQSCITTPGGACD
ncbi:hypothetical protein [Paraburkholderia sp. MM5384-R2]|uniref:hypothetical protein n=1 Tax=Paraburkholderia sp. MM5384-R2 TaxID=2723097 RepID=UPI001617669B|nr:hypothetical protein [Paraburkholderia sp. MM5384-R2]MBB5497413.1 hypothetical protein [Paraburkholderia sp. MM5384-R2]